jgi:transcriptional regulator with XRE-family HTH domain
VSAAHSGADRRIDRVVLLSLVSADRWTPVSEIGAQLGVSDARISEALTDAIGAGAAVDAAPWGYRRRSADRPAVETPPPSPIVRREPFGRLVRARRAALGLSQNGLARLAGVDPAYVNRMERDQRVVPGRAVILALADALELDDRETDRLLYAAGLAPVTDWQARAERAEAALETVRDALAVLDEPATRKAVAS